MKTATIITICVLISAGSALADWKPNEPAKYVQLPDRAPTGIDIKVGDALIPDPIDPGNLIRVNKVLADDFPCKQRELITDIHLWGSWKFDEPPKVELPSGSLENKPGNLVFRLGIWTDEPALIDPGTGQVLEHSRPRDLKWSRVFLPGDFRTVNAFTGPEGWYNPNTQEFRLDNHDEAYQYNFLIPEAEAFEQEGLTADGKPTIYWLSVDVLQVIDIFDDAKFGWKTRDPIDDGTGGGGHFLDDATWADMVWQVDAAFPDGHYVNMTPWAELCYPDEHPLHPDSIDMAFVITPEPATMTLLAIGGLAVLRRRRRS